MPEYYLKKTPQSDAEGPYTEAQLIDLVQKGRVTTDTLHFYDDLLGWQPIAKNEALRTALFSRPKLSFKKSADPVSTAAPAHHKKEAKITVEGMLQMAQGKTDATKAQTQQKMWADRVAALSLPVLTIFNLVMGGLMLFAHWESFMKLFSGNFSALIFAPGVALGLLITFLGFLLLLSLVSAYPAVRYLAFALMGYLSVQAWGHLYAGLPQGWLLLAAGLGFGLGVYTITLTLNFALFVLALLAALGGIASYGYFLFFVGV